MKCCERLNRALCCQFIYNSTFVRLLCYDIINYRIPLQFDQTHYLLLYNCIITRGERVNTANSLGMVDRFALGKELSQFLIVLFLDLLIYAFVKDTYFFMNYKLSSKYFPIYNFISI